MAIIPPPPPPPHKAYRWKESESKVICLSPYIAHWKFLGVVGGGWGGGGKQERILRMKMWILWSIMAKCVTATISQKCIRACTVYFITSSFLELTKEPLIWLCNAYPILTPAKYQIKSNWSNQYLYFPFHRHTSNNYSSSSYTPSK